MPSVKSTTGGSDFRVADEGDGSKIPYGLNGAPAGADLLNGFVSAAGTLLTIPAGATWVGNIVITAVTNVASGGSSASGTVSVSTAGSGVLPTAGVQYQADTSAPASAASGVGTEDRAVVGPAPLTVVAPAANAVTLTVASSGTITKMDVHAVGYLIKME
jgi:hypothetical protein